MRGAKAVEIHSIMGVYFKRVTMKYTGTKILASFQVMLRPAIKPRFNVSKVTGFAFLKKAPPLFQRNLSHYYNMNLFSIKVSTPKQCIKINLSDYFEVMAQKLDMIYLILDNFF